MRHIFNRLLIALILMGITLTLSACDLLNLIGGTDLTVDERAQTAIAETLAVEHNIQTVVAGTLGVSDTSAVVTPGEQPPVVVQEEQPPAVIQTPEPAATDTPDSPIVVTDTPEHTPTSGVAMVSVSRNINCRSGPGTEYAILGVLMMGVQAEVVGIFPEWDYWIIKNPDKPGVCWLWGQYATVVGETAGLPLYTPPPTPTPTRTATPTQTLTPAFNWSGSWTTSMEVPPGGDFLAMVITFTQTGSTVTGAADFAAFTGTLSADNTTLTGTYAYPGGEQPFIFRLINANQFIGNRDSGALAWCGHRAGAGLPTPCMGP